MATVLEQTGPGTGRRRVAIGAAGLLVAALAAGVLGRTAAGGVERSARPEPAAVSVQDGPQIEAVRAQNFESRSPAVTPDIEAVRAQNYVPAELD